MFTVDVPDPPPGWDDRKIQVRHRNIPYDQIGHAVATLLELSYKLWLKAGCPGKAAPTVRVSRAPSPSTVKN